MSGVRTTDTQQIIIFLQRNGQGAFTTNRSPRDAWHAYLQSVTGKQHSSTQGLETEWLNLRITQLASAPPAGATASDLWREYLQRKGHSGSMADMFNQWLDHGTV